MASWCLTFALGFIFFCTQGLPTHGKRVHKPLDSKPARDCPPPVEDGFVATLEVFSGVPDPCWTILNDHPLYSQINTLSASAPDLDPEVNAPPKLGYEGFVLQKMTNGEKTTEKLIVGPETVELQKLLLQSIPDDTVSTAIKNVVKEEIGSVSPVNVDTTKRYAPARRLEYWNHPDHIRLNNCYNYASTIRNDQFQQPGSGAGQPFPYDFSGEDVKIASEADGCIYQTNETHMCAPNGAEHLAALFIYIGESGLWFDKDYHWYRLDNDGYWTHKPGQTPATDRDGNGNKIRDPRKAAQGSIPYKFYCFMTINRNTIRIPAAK